VTKEFNLNIIKFSVKPLKSPATTRFKPPVLGKYTQSVMFLYEIRLDTQENAEAPQIEVRAVFLVVMHRKGASVIKVSWFCTPTRCREGEPVCQATAEAEPKLKIQLHCTDGRILRAIEAALGRINHRVYGVCESCKRPIARARLEAVRWSRHSRECKEQEHA